MRPRYRLEPSDNVWAPSVYLRWVVQNMRWINQLLVSIWLVCESVRVCSILIIYAIWNVLIWYANKAHFPKHSLQTIYFADIYSLSVDTMYLCRAVFCYHLLPPFTDRTFAKFLAKREKPHKRSVSLFHVSVSYMLMHTDDLRDPFAYSL